MVIDASVALKWFLPEDRTREAKALLNDVDVLSAPRLILLETAHVLWKAYQRGRLTSEAFERADEVLRGLFDSGASTDGLTLPAGLLMRQLNHPIYDCIYIALAQREGAMLVTADERQFAAARRARVSARLL